MSGQTQPGNALQALAEKLRTDAIAIFGEGQAERDIIEWFYAALLAALTATPAAQGAVPYGFMPIPTAEQLAEALENVRSFHDMSAELIAPEMLTNLLAALPPAREGVREWIPVSERLPADSRDVLVYCSDTDEHMVGSSMGCGRFAFAFSERGTRICCKPSHWRYIEDSDKPTAAPAHPAERQEQGEFGDAYQGAREDLAIWKRRALEAEEKLRKAEQSTPAAIEVIGYASPGQVEILRKLPRTGGMKVRGCKDGRYTEPVVLLSDARRAMISLAARCQQEGAFKTCLECGYQDGHDEICQFHARNRKLQPAKQVPAAEAAQSAPDDVFEEGQWWLAELDSVVANGTLSQRRAMAVVRNLLSCWQRTQATAVPVGWQFYQDGKWWNGDDRVKDHRANTEAAGVPVRDVYAALAQPALQGEQQPVGEMISNDGDIYWADRHPPIGTKLYAAPIAQTAQSEVQRLREALEGMLEYFPEGASDGECFAVDAARAALAASTGQEVGK